MVFCWMTDREMESIFLQHCFVLSFFNIVNAVFPQTLAKPAFPEKKTNIFIRKWA